MASMAIGSCLKQTMANQGFDAKRGLVLDREGDLGCTGAIHAAFSLRQDLAIEQTAGRNLQQNTC